MRYLVPVGLVLGGVVAYVALWRAPAVPESAPVSEARRVASESVQGSGTAPPQPLDLTSTEAAMPRIAQAPEAPPPDSLIGTPPLTEPAPTEGQAPSVPASVAQPARPPKPELADPAARVALFFVGADAEAEGYWYTAINDPSLPPGEREDLIEDLNEEGLSDPRSPGPEDLPLLLNRLDLIEQYAPYAMDQVNADAFQEAYKDLVNLVMNMPE